MRRLLYIPIIHTEEDLGSLALELACQSAALCGQEQWAEHQEMARRFWQSIADYLCSLDAACLRIYQDGLAAGGEAARRVVEEAARRGSPNYRLLQDLVGRGAVIRKTEDPTLLLGEWQDLARALKDAGRGYQKGRDRLMEARDRFIARTINETLQPGEMGVLLLGADHGVFPYLDRNIQVQPLKDREKVRAYFQALLERDGRRWRALANYLAFPVVVSPMEERIRPGSERVH